MKLSALSIFLITGTLAFFSCKKEAVTYDCTSTAPTYTKDIKPIMDASCASSGCHSAQNPAEGINLSSYTGTKGAAAKDDFLASIQQTGSAKAMPKGGSKLSDDKIKLIYCWIQNGTPQ